jgi:hypothetical protein
MDYGFVGLFALEAVLKSVMRGFLFNGNRSYLRNGWNFIDFVIVLSGIALLCTDALLPADSGSKQLAALRALRMLRALRPLRLASRSKGMQVVATAIIKSVPPLGNVILVGLLFYLVFAILGVNLFAGTFYSCVSAESGERCARAEASRAARSLRSRD